MASYYYLMSSLPMLSSDGEMPFAYDTFVSMCENAVSTKQFERLKGLSLSSTDGPLLKEWSEFYGEYGKELAYQRNKRLGMSYPQPYPRVEKTVKAVLASLFDENPLNAEKQLLAAQFEKLDELIGTHTFDDEALFGYALKLKLLERKTVFKYKDGKEESERIFDELYKKITDFE